MSATYLYDPEGRRREKQITGGSFAGTTQILDAGDDEIAEYDGSGTLLRRYIPGRAIDEPIAMVTASGTITYFHRDKTDSVVAMSNSSGVLTEGPYTYDAYGNCLVGGVACATGVPFKYTGQRFDPETGNYYYRARFYDPLLGRFLQTDPIGYKDDIDWYDYVGDDPTDRNDPSGLCDATEGNCKTIYVNHELDDRPASNKNANGARMLAVTGPGIGHNGGPALEEAASRASGPLIRRLLAYLGPVGEFFAFSGSAGSSDEDALVRGSSAMRAAATGKGNFGIGSATASDSNAWGRAWVGPGATTSSDGTALTSENGLRQYRPPQYKPNLKRTQSNFERRFSPSGKWQSNAHLDIVDP